MGINSHRSFFQDLLDRHIERELPKVRQEVREHWSTINEGLVHIGAERPSPSQIRAYFTLISTESRSDGSVGLR